MKSRWCVRYIDICVTRGIRCVPIGGPRLFRAFGCPNECALVSE